MSDHTMVRLAFLLSVLNFGITVAHIAHDVMEFADIRYHIDQNHPGFEK